MSIKTVLSVAMASAIVFGSCGRKNDEKKEKALEGLFQLDASKELITDWVIDGNKNDILVIDNKGKIVRTVTKLNDNKQEIKSSVESYAIIGKKSFKILQSVSSKNTLRLNGKNESLSADLQKIDGEYQVINKNLVKLFFDAKKVKGFTLTRKVFLPDVAPLPTPSPTPSPAPTPKTVPEPANAGKTPALTEAEQKVLDAKARIYMKNIFAAQRAKIILGKWTVVSDGSSFEFLPEAKGIYTNKRVEKSFAYSVDGNNKISLTYGPNHTDVYKIFEKWAFAKSFVVDFRTKTDGPGRYLILGAESGGGVKPILIRKP